MKKKQYKIELSSEAEDDFEKSYEFYAEENEKVADNYFKQVDNSLKKISKSPLTYPKAHRNIRKYVIKKFPFVIYYKVTELIVRVVAIFHTSRNPEIWKNRPGTLKENDI